MKYQAEYTDTFGTEANYSWVRRAEFECTVAGASSKLIVRRAKAALELVGVKGKITYDNGDLIEYRPEGMCTVIFITPID